MLLETLSDAQKRQVWRATPEPVRIKLKQIREASYFESTLEESGPENWNHLEPNLGNSNQPGLSAGNQVVLIAKPKLTAAELIAIWDVIEVHGRSARIKAEQLGIRNYPISWMIGYPTSLNEQA
jgi:hypothetical protein